MPIFPLLVVGLLASQAGPLETYAHDACTTGPPDKA
jgi:hypothetical protein